MLSRICRFFMPVLTVSLCALNVGCQSKGNQSKSAPSTTNVAAGRSPTKQSASPTRKAQPAPSGYPVRVTDDRGKTILIPRPPQRIVVAGTALYAEVLMDLGARQRIVGMTASSNTPPSLRKVPSVGRAWPLNLEKVLALKPDLILGTFGIYRSRLEQLTNVPIYTGGQKNAAIASLADIYTIIRKLDRILHGNQRRAERLLQTLQHEIKQLQTRYRRKQRVKTAILYMPEPNSSRIYIVNRHSPAHELLEMAGGENLFAQQRGFAVNIELLVQKNPDVIITDPKHVHLIQTHPALQRLKAVTGKRIYGIQASHYTSSRLVRVYRKLVQALGR